MLTAAGAEGVDVGTVTVRVVNKVEVPEMVVITWVLTAGGAADAGVWPATGQYVVYA